MGVEIDMLTGGASVLGWMATRHRIGVLDRNVVVLGLMPWKYRCGFMLSTYEVK